MYNDELKCLDRRYHQCLKEVIIAKINFILIFLFKNHISMTLSLKKNNVN